MTEQALKNNEAYAVAEIKLSSFIRFVRYLYSVSIIVYVTNFTRVGIGVAGFESTRDK